ncbi:MAG: MurR/RpiR family transcriptional regulator [Chloroflexota bacterium]
MGNTLSGPLVEALEARLPELPRKQQELARTILETPELVALGSVRDLAAQLGMNNATIIRFAKTLGFSGYQAMQADVREAYLARAGARPRPGAEGPAAETAARQLANLQAAHADLDPGVLDRVADALAAARRIVVCATGSAVVPGMALVRFLRHVGLRGELVDGGGVDRVIALRDVGPEDVVVVFGLWLAFDEQARALQDARARGATTVAVVGSMASPLGRLADLALLAPAQGAALPLSVAATVAVAEIVAAHVAARRPDLAAGIEDDLHDRYLLEGLLAPAFPPRARK